MKNNYLVEIDELRIQETCDAYFKWKDLNTYIKSLVSRGINMPDAISEPMGCYCLDLLWNKKSGGDAQTRDGKKIEFKASSNYDLVFLRFNLDTNMLYVYDTGINSDQLKLIEISSYGTVGSYQKQGKRPHFSIINKIINDLEIEPTVIFNIRKGVIEEKNF